MASSSTGMVLCEIFSAVTLTALFRALVVAPLPSRLHGSYAGWGQLLSISIPVAATSLLGTILGSANAVLIPAKLVAGGADPSAAHFRLWRALRYDYAPAQPAHWLYWRTVPSPGAEPGPEARPGRRPCRPRFFGPGAVRYLPAHGPRHGSAHRGGRPTWPGGVFRGRSRRGDYMSPTGSGLPRRGAYQSVLSGALNGVGRQGLAARNAIVSDAVQLAFTFFTVARWGLGRPSVAGFVLSPLGRCPFKPPLCASLCQASPPAGGLVFMPLAGRPAHGAVRKPILSDMSGSRPSSGVLLPAGRRSGNCGLSGCSPGTGGAPPAEKAKDLTCFLHKIPIQGCNFPGYAL